MKELFVVEIGSPSNACAHYQVFSTWEIALERAKQTVARHQAQELAGMDTPALQEFSSAARDDLVRSGTFIVEPTPPEARSFFAHNDTTIVRIRITHLDAPDPFI